MSNATASTTNKTKQKQQGRRRKAENYEKLTYFTADMTFLRNQSNSHAVSACNFENSHLKAYKTSDTSILMERDVILLLWSLSNWKPFSSCVLCLEMAGKVMLINFMFQSPCASTFAVAALNCTYQGVARELGEGDPVQKTPRGLMDTGRRGTWRPC